MKVYAPKPKKFTAKEEARVAEAEAAYTRAQILEFGVIKYLEVEGCHMNSLPVVINMLEGALSLRKRYNEIHNELKKGR